MPTRLRAYRYRPPRPTQLLRLIAGNHKSWLETTARPPLAEGRFLGRQQPPGRRDSYCHAGGRRYGHRKGQFQLRRRLRQLLPRHVSLSSGIELPAGTPEITISVSSGFGVHLYNHSVNAIFTPFGGVVTATGGRGDAYSDEQQ